MPLMMFHMTNTHILPYMGWGESNLDLEWQDNETLPSQAKFPHALLRAESLGRQTGNIPVVLARFPNAKTGVGGARRPEDAVRRKWRSMRSSRTWRAGG